MAEADWSQLPKDLLTLISQRIDTEIDLIRFRSICSNWRSSSIPNHHNILPFKFPLLKCEDNSIKYNDNEIIDSINNTDSLFCYLSKRSIFLVKPPPSQLEEKQTLIPRRPWLIRFTQNSHGKTKLFHPLIKYPRPQQEETLAHPRVFDFNKLSVLHLGTDFILDKVNFTSRNRHGIYMLPKTVLAVTCHGKDPLILGSLGYCSYRPLLFRDRDEHWKPIPKMSSLYGDTCVFKGQLYAVHQSGQTVTIGPDSSVELAAQPLGHDSPGWNKMLVESEGRLLLLGIEESSNYFSIDFFELDEKKKKWVRLMDFDEKEKKWVKLRNFGDRVFFIGRGCSFSASASDLCIQKGNCAIFIDESVLHNNNMVRGKRVFHLDQDRLSRGSKYLNLFLPPEWILKI
ncbi:hypothetical protein MtrunA17_Chr3g0088551 [Medicago truncatula]|uniref:Uncharacterized protein n=1 Tax=Medicago truncatula TaxID=3880 RepID=A0A396IPF2_MEDTR|nr:F-box protein SKIP23-like [Medicago truncatula]RHN66224.1 hypothetical protein MtrunA17_Chr3g0088551 [Medicago truncatula]